MEQQTIKQMEQNVAELLAKAEEMKQLIEKAKKEKEEVWPVNGNRYWFASGDGFTYHGAWGECITDIDRKKFGNVHRTKEDAENYVQKRLIQVELETLAKKAWKKVNKQVNWTDEYQSKCHIYYDYIDKEFCVSANSTSQCIGQVFFPARESAMNAVKTIGEERLKKLFM